MTDIKKQIQEATEAGLCLGHPSSQIHPKMKPYILMEKQNIHIIDVQKSLETLQKAMDFLKLAKKQEKTFLLVGTKVQVKDLTEKTAKEINIPYVCQRWLGGTLTNFQTIKKRIDYFKELEQKNLDKYTKKEKQDFEKEKQDLDLKIGGIKNMEKLPDVLIVLDMRKDLLAVKEARKKEITIIGVADTNINPELADYPILANDDKVSSIQYILDNIKKALL
ncbi:MAG: 30S ribosomal protein S2 [Candidatus Pacebacteria bacterium]|nr:30S ribosomal protein S2 [Candidatus Paceibacterota bacterium]